MRAPFLSGFAALLALFSCSSSALAETIRATSINKVPFTISKPGIYILGKVKPTAISTGAAITIATDNVVLDLNGRALVGTVGASSQAIGILSEGHSFITVKNGLVSGFMDGVSLRGDSAELGGHVIDGITADSNYRVGLIASGLGAAVRRCTVSKTGGSTVDGGTFAIGIQLLSLLGSVVECDVLETQAIGAIATGITVNGTGSFADGNRVRNLTVTPSTIGILLFNSLARNNQIHGMATAIEGNGTTKAFNNLTLNCTVPFSGVTSLVGVNN